MYAVYVNFYKPMFAFMSVSTACHLKNGSPKEDLISEDIPLTTLKSAWVREAWNSVIRICMGRLD